MIERQIVCGDLSLALDDLRREGFRVDVIYPADRPHTAVLTRGGEVLRVTTQPGSTPPHGLPPFEPAFVLTRAGAAADEGRAGMLYRDLIPGRLGGRYIASLIIIREGGPVADWVHYHRIGVQVIAVRTGWVRVVYEDQGEPFVMEAGDLVLQPPGIRHRVLESSAGLEVVELTAPAIHETFADHELELPNARVDPGRIFESQRFLRHVAGQGDKTGVNQASGGLADVRTRRLAASESVEIPAHQGELVFGFVMEGSGQLAFGKGFELGPADAFVIPPGAAWSLTAGADGLRLLHVTTACLD